ncbi:hypothetical protein [uncultured Treponema sp.]|uniref:hypothetical protein n=1 Tax=uncultured Treponema sp. TaxID=162155 RepID=UPI0025CC92E1|nr:hypothetical protein [uncultured Treponema sp.]
MKCNVKGRNYGKRGFFYDDFAFVCGGISDCLFSEAESEKDFERVGMLSIFLTVIF